MRDQILVPLDGSPFAEQALPLAKDLARLHKAEICLFRVASHDSRLSEAEVYLEEQRAAVMKNGLECRAEVVVGDTTSFISQASGRPGMICMSSHGQSGYHDVVLGGVSQGVLRSAQCPVMVVKQNPIRLRDIRRILVPLDGSSASHKAIGPAKRLALESGAELLLSRVSDAQPGARSIEEESQNVQRYFEKICSRFEPTIKVQKVHGFGTPSRFLLEQLKAAQIDLVALSSHGDSGFRQSLCGSVTENLLRASSVPLLVIRVPGPD